MAEYGFGAAFTAVLHPVGFSRFLIQLGHEPLPAEPSKSFFGFGEVKMYYPNVYRYMKYIKQKEGFTGLYRGVVPRVVAGFVGSYTTSKANQYFKKLREKEDSEENSNDIVIWAKTFFIETSQEAAARCLGIIVNQPFQVIMLRCMAQFIGGETKYSSILSSIGEIYRNDGILGFFAGIVPRILGEVISLFLTNFISHLVNKFCVEDKEMKSYTSGACGLIIGTFTYRFQLVGNLMSVSGSGLAASYPPYMRSYASWTDCWSHLRAENQLNRGSRVFNRIAN